MNRKRIQSIRLRQANGMRAYPKCDYCYFTPTESGSTVDANELFVDGNLSFRSNRLRTSDNFPAIGSVITTAGGRP